MRQRFHALLIACLFAPVTFSTSRDATAEGPVNVLFIAADDLRCDLGCYGHPLVQTPHLDRLAARGVLFRHAYCQQALCNPSRASLLTGLRPDTLELWNLANHFRDRHPEAVTLPQHFLRQGHFAQGIGKIFHNWRTEVKGDPASWSVPSVMHFARHGDDLPVVKGELPTDLSVDPKCECRDVADEAYFDGRIARLAVQTLGELKGRGQPFFLAVGFWKPHAPFNAPKRYWDLYDRESVTLPMNEQWPIETPRIAWHNGREILGTPARQLNVDAVREIRHGYLAGISYLDAQVGRVLSELDRLKLTDSTVIVFWSDHGYHLGEHSLWAKTSNFERDAKVPLIIAVPGQQSGGRQVDEVVELLDVFPTLTDLAGVPTPAGLEGDSLVPLLQGKAQGGDGMALTQHPRPAYYKGKMDAMGHSLRTDRYRYTRWVDPADESLIAEELYDHHQDPTEAVNLADRAEHTALVTRLAEMLATKREGP